MNILHGTCPFTSQDIWRMTVSLLCQVLLCLYGMDIRDAELASLERKRGGKAKKRKRKAADDVATSFKEADAGAWSLIFMCDCTSPAPIKARRGSKDWMHSGLMKQALVTLPGARIEIMWGRGQIAIHWL